MGYSKNIKQRRVEKAWTQDQLSTISGVSYKTISRVENGNNANSETLMKLAAAFDIPVSELKKKSKTDDLNSQKVFELKIEFGFELERVRHEFNVYISSLESINSKLRNGLDVTQKAKDAVKKQFERYSECSLKIRRLDFSLRKYLSDAEKSEYIKISDDYFDSLGAKVGLAYSRSPLEYQTNKVRVQENYRNAVDEISCYLES